jgi:peptidoglycan/LPS O-acetylase OafA/YrhL
MAIVASIAFTSATSSPSLAAYLWRRIVRIFPLYLTINAAIFGASFLYPSRLGQPFTLREFALSSAGLSLLFGERFLSEVFWFIPFIFQIYVVLGLGGKRLLRLPWRGAFLLAFVVSACEIVLLSRIIPDALIETRKWSPLLRLPELLFGLMTAATLSHVLPAREFFLNIVVYGALCSLLALGAVLIPAASYLFALPLHGLIVTIVVTLLSSAALLLVNKAHLATTTLRFIGRATFPFFLIHGVGLRFVDAHWHSRPSAWLAYLAACLLGAGVLEMIFGPSLRAKALSPATAQ